MKRLVATLALLLLLARPAAAEDYDWIAGVEDLPLMPGLIELAEKSLVFDKPDGRIVEADALGRGIQAASVERFYAETMPALGWTVAGPLVYRREGDVLRIVIERTRGGLNVHFSIRPGGG